MAMASSKMAVVLFFCLLFKGTMSSPVVLRPSLVGKHPSAASCLKIRGGGASDGELVVDAFEWCSNLGAPAALVAGAVLATLVETREDMGPSRKDVVWIQVCKKITRMLLLSSFALEIISIFVTTVTGTMLMSHGDRAAGVDAGIHYHSAMGFLRHNLEFEYLTSRITFLQGLLNWLAAVALEALIPKPDESDAARRMNFFISSSLVTIILCMVSFYNHHMTFYHNYLDMLQRYIRVVFKRYLGHWPPRPMAWLYVPSIVITCFLGYRAFVSPPEDEDQGELAK